MINKENKNARRLHRHLRVRKDLSGTTSAPRLSVYRSTSNIYAQIIDDTKGTTLCAASTLSAELAGKLDNKTKCERAGLVGELIGKLALEKGIKTVVFDRGGYLYTGRVHALAEGARKAGLEF